LSIPSIFKRKAFLIDFVLNVNYPYVNGLHMKYQSLDVLFIIICKEFN